MVRPSLIPRPCLVPRCPEYAVVGRSYCARHIRERWDLGLTGETRRGRELARLRKIVFARQHGRCLMCGAEATVLHHKRSAYESDLDQLVALCDTCHKAAHAPGPRRRLGP